MGSISNFDLLSVWERGARLHPVDQGLLILGLAFAETPYDVLADWPLGRRNSELARVRLALSGPEINGWVACPNCSEKLEFQLDARIFASAEAAMTKEPIIVNGRRFRLPSSRDLALAANEQNPAIAARMIAERCCLDATGAFEDWTESELEEIGESMAEADSLAETLLSLSCPQCREEWSESFEIARFLWIEIEARAKALLRDVHVLAGAYGWAENDILAMADLRRSAYLGMVQ
jgi:hypothetical protein